MPINWQLLPVFGSFCERIRFPCGFANIASHDFVWLCDYEPWKFAKPRWKKFSFFAWRLFCIIFRVWLFFHWRWSSRSPRRKILMYTFLTLFLPQPLAFKLVPSPGYSHYGQRHNSIDNWIWSGYNCKYSSLLEQQRINHNTCVVVFAHFSHFWEKVLTYFSMISIYLTFYIFRNISFGYFAKRFPCVLGDTCIFLRVLFRVFVKTVRLWYAFAHQGNVCRVHADNIKLAN